MSKVTFPKCPRGCYPTAINAVGVAIEEHRGVAGWVAVGARLSTYCEANAVLDKIPVDDIERRVYTAFPTL